MLLHSTVAGTHIVAVVAVACMFPAAVGIIVVGVAALAPSGTCCLLAVVVSVGATVADVVGWVVYGVVGDEAAMCIGHFVVPPSRLPVYPIRIGLCPCSLS